MLILFLIAFVVFGGIFIAAMALTREERAKKKAKKQAKEILEGGDIDQIKVQKVLNVLSATQDNEGKCLYSKLADLAEKK